MNLGLRFGLGLALLAHATGAAAEELLYLRERYTEIPINFEDHANRDQISKMVLWVSEDAGKSWQQAGVAYPTDKHFTFRAKADGQYWFSLVTVYKDGRLDPANVGAQPPGLKMIFDTQEPLIKLHCEERQQGLIGIRWQIADDNPLELATLTLEWREEGGKWAAVPIPSAPSGVRRWPVGSTGPLQVRMAVQDKAGNTGRAVLDIPAQQPNLVLSTATPPSPPLPPPSPPPYQSDMRKPAVATGLPPAPPPQPPMNTGFVPARSPQLPQVGPNPYAVHPSPLHPALHATPLEPVDAGPRVIARTEGSGYPTMQASWQSSPTPTSEPVHTGQVRPRGPLPPLRYANQLRALLNYEISRVGPSGVGAVELWLTSDDGRTWRKFAEDHDLTPPMQIDFPGEGVYGLTMIIRSRANLGRAAPQPGEVPEMRVEVDLTPPFGELHQVEADPQRRDTLVFRWNASDRNLVANPISILWSDKETGPWMPIASEVPNTGRYLWKMPPNLPYMVYLRLEVRDAAGNVGVAQTPKPVLVDLVEPEGKLIGITTPGKN